MKNSMYKAVAAFACAAILAACGGSSTETTSTTALPPQPVFTKTDIAAGSGSVAAAAGDLVTVHLTGYLYDESKTDKKGAQFETTIGATPLALNLGFGSVRVIGWDQGLVGMKVGAKRTLLIPASMAYGATGYIKDSKTLVPANTAVVYDMEMLSITTLPSPPKPVQPTFAKIDATVGTGTEAVSGKTVGVHYTGWLYDATKTDNKGAQFDTSRNGSPFSFKLGSGGVITGWEQGIPGMKVGGKRTLIIPADMAYGANGSGNSIPPNAALLFEVELMSVN